MPFSDRFRHLFSKPGTPPDPEDGTGGALPELAPAGPASAEAPTQTPAGLPAGGAHAFSGDGAAGPEADAPRVTEAGAPSADGAVFRFEWRSSDGPFPPERAFDWGTIDGARQIDKQHFEAYLEHSVREEEALARLKEAESAIARWTALEEEALAARAEMVRAEATLELAEAHAARLRAEQEVRLAQLAAEAKEARERAEAEGGRARAVPSGRGVPLYAGLFIAAGAVFILGDFVIARSTVADALSMPGWKASVFAAGLGAMPFVFKPFFDRFLEEPYHEGKTRRYFIAISLLCLLTVGVLWVLGALRSESFVANKQSQRAQQVIAETRNRLSQLDLNPALFADPDAERAQLQALIEQQQQAQAESQERLLRSPLGFWSYILSGILFALAGALCLSIGLKHWRDHDIYRKKPKERADGFYALADEQDEKAEALRREPLFSDAEAVLPSLRAALARARADFEASYPIADCRERTEAGRQAHREAQEEFFAQRRAKLIALYRDGYELGLKNPQEPGTAKGPSTTGPAFRQRSLRRPYLALRKAVSRRGLGEETEPLEAAS